MPIDIKVPVLAESIAEASLLSWHKNIGDMVKRGDNLIDIETDKVTLEVSAPDDGILTEILKQEGDQVKSDEIIARINTETKQVTQPAPKEQGVSEQQTLLETEPEATRDTPPKLSPAVRNLLAEKKLKIEDITERKDTERLTKEDVLTHLENVADDPATAPTPASVEPGTPSAAPPPEEVEEAVLLAKVEAAAPRPEERVRMTRLRKRIAEHLLAAQHENALLTTFNEVNMQPVIELRSRYKEEFEQKHQVKLGFMSFFTKAVVEALKKFPVINASVDAEDIIYRGYFDIGIAVSSPRGLVVPVVRDADTLSFAAIESAIREYGQKAKEGKLTIDELTGGTFTITNGGVFGSLLSTPIINPPQSAILGMHKINERPMAEKGQVVVRPMMYLALSYDHRIIDGREAVQFLVLVKEQIEDPTRLLLQV